jgi:putative SOS response-associated peptidase YedK
MCYHISFEVKLESVLDYFPDLVVDNQPEFEYPSAPYLDGFRHPGVRAIVESRKDDKKHLASMMWGFLPGYIKNMEEAERFWNGYKDDSGKWHTGYITLDAIGEELLVKPLYKDAAKNRRCILLIDGFYEWHHYYPIGKKGQRLKTALKYPHHISLKDNPYPFAMVAAIWNPWKDTEVDKETGEVTTSTVPTLAMATTVANDLMAKIHNSKRRMPTFLTMDLAKEWLQPNLNDKRIIELATNQYPADKMEAFSIPQDFRTLTNPKERKQYPEIEAEFC